MNRATRDKFASGTKQVDLTTGNACWETAPLVFAKLAEDFGPFDIDLTADATRHLCALWFGPDSPVGERNALTARWHHYGQSGYSNPPYGIFVNGTESKHGRGRKGLLEKAKEEAQIGFCSTLLLPLRITRSFRRHVLDGAAEVLLPDKRFVFFEDGAPRINRRMFVEKGKVIADGALFDSVLVRYEPGHVGPPVLKTWKVPKHVTADDLERARERLALKATA